MIIETRDFGNMEIESTQIITFKHPILGFESLKNYVLISNNDASDEFRWLQSTDDSNVCFIVVDPSSVFSSYKPVISTSSYLSLDCDDTHSISLWAIIVITQDFKRSTVNLKSPIIVNHKNNIAIQAVLDDDFSIREPLFGENFEDGGV